MVFFYKLTDGRLLCRFFDRKSFDIDTNYFQKTFQASVLKEVAKSTLELTIWLNDEFELERHTSEVRKQRLDLEHQDS